MMFEKLFPLFYFIFAFLVQLFLLLILREFFFFISRSLSLSLSLSPINFQLQHICDVFLGYLRQYRQKTLLGKKKSTFLK